MSLHLFLSHADTHGPVLAEDLPVAAAREAPGVEASHASHPGHLTDRSGLSDALPAQRWGVVVPRGEAGKRLLASIEPLRRKRAADQDAEVVVYEVDPGMGPEEANRWISRDYWDAVGRRADDLPRYLLILGGPDLVSWDLQQMLGGEAFVGRLAFTDDRGRIDEAACEAYVDKVLRWEKADREAPIPGSRVIFYSARDGSPAVKQGYDHLIAPVTARARDLALRGKLPSADIVEIGAGAGPSSTDDLLDQAHDLLSQAAVAEGGVLFSMSHGLGVPASGSWPGPEEQRRMQGAMRISRQGDRLTAADVRGRKFMPGGLWLFFACFGAGTPARSAYLPWIERLSARGVFGGSAESLIRALPKAGAPPFVAALPQAALADPDGPLGVIGHVDLAWTWSFLDDLTAGAASMRARSERFEGVVESAVRGHRLGVAHAEIAHFFGEVNQALATLYDESAAPRDAATDARIDRRADLWMQRQDLAAHVLLGDPAARLPIAPSPPGLPAREVDEDGGSLVAFAAPPRGRGAAEMEAAVLACLRGAETSDAIAGRTGVAREELEGWVETYRDWGRRGLAQRR